MTATEKVVAAILQQLKKELEVKPENRLYDDLGLDSLNLVELTIRIHSEHGIDLGRKAVEMKVIPETVADVIALVEAA